MPGPILRVVNSDDTGRTRRCFKLLPDRARSLRDRRASMFGGLPFWPAARPWPVCSGCGRPLSFLAQVRRDEIPDLPQGFASLLSCFFCFSCVPWWDVNGQGFHAEWLPLGGDPPLLPARKVPLEVPSLAPLALRLEPGKDSPSLWDHPDGEHFSPAQRAIAAREGPYEGSKMLGWPAWLQSPQVPVCRHCGGPMRFLGQFSSRAPAAVEFGGGGRIFWFSCEAECRPDALSFLLQDE